MPSKLAHSFFILYVQAHLNNLSVFISYVIRGPHNGVAEIQVIFGVTLCRLVHTYQSLEESYWRSSSG